MEKHKQSGRKNIHSGTASCQLSDVGPQDVASEIIRRVVLYTRGNLAVQRLAAGEGLCRPKLERPLRLAKMEGTDHNGGAAIIKSAKAPQSCFNCVLWSCRPSSPDCRHN
ncbi:hypothetical protein EYF80_007912 [Liparis tanakae]|uniref:Uncharacterized protein n=1 Tax=Liparis tanakae TaxID=230148 RepID=A0A4Z2IWZ1_9TELE|nr:hypothetical protein EYF80_007912 [Liparis tanakae]